MTREELKRHCLKQIGYCEMLARHKGEEPHGKIYEENKLILELLEQKQDPMPCKDGKDNSDVMLSDLDLSMSYVLESDHRSFTNRETETGWLFDKIIEWRKMIQLYIKENEDA